MMNPPITFRKTIVCRGGACTGLMDVDFEKPKGMPEVKILRCPECMTLNLVEHNIPWLKRKNINRAFEHLEMLDDHLKETKGTGHGDDDLRKCWIGVLYEYEKDWMTFC